MIFRPLISAIALVGSVQFAAADPTFWKFEWPETDFDKTSVGWTEVMSGGPPKDGIPALDEVVFLKVADDTQLTDREAVITVELEGSLPRAYPIRYLTWHEIANDVIDGVPVAVTFCPLCNSGITFDRRVNGQVLSFGVSGKLRNSDMIMYDRETQSWWQQAIGTGIVGDMLGVELTQLPTWMESWQEFKTRNPDGIVMNQPRWPRNYGRNPYVGYDSSRTPFLYNGEMPPHDIPALMRVVRVGDSAWPLSRFKDDNEVTENGVTISWTSGQSSALDSVRIGEGKDVGTIRVRNEQGEDVPHDVLFAFAFHAFWPDGQWMLGE